MAEAVRSVLLSKDRKSCSFGTLQPLRLSGFWVSRLGFGCSELVGLCVIVADERQSSRGLRIWIGCHMTIHQTWVRALRQQAGAREGHKL